MAGDNFDENRRRITAPIEKYCMEKTTMTAEEAHEFAFRCWQLNFVKIEHYEGHPLSTIRSLNYISNALLNDIELCLLSDVNMQFDKRDMSILQEAIDVMKRLDKNIIENIL